MAKITLEKLRHSYFDSPHTAEDYALQQIDIDWQDGGAYALLGPSGCGKTTLLNLISGLRTPTEGRILFDDKDVTHIPTDQRNIAQVFQFPVIYDTMRVYENLAFPLRNRGLDPQHIDQRVKKIADMLEITDLLNQRAAGLSPDNKQRLSMGRGLVREDVNVVMFDEPLTVIDPHQKWMLRAKLKELHQQIRHTLIYVTHDQTEALTFADEVVVMAAGKIVQIGTPIDLFEQPAHTFVGHFIGSPGMNILPCVVENSQIILEGHALATTATIDQEKIGKNGKMEVGIRPEFIKLAKTGVPARIGKIADVGKHAIIEAIIGNQPITALHVFNQHHSNLPAEGSLVHLAFDPDHTRLYVDGWLAMK